MHLGFMLKLPSVGLWLLGIGLAGKLGKAGCMEQLCTD